MSVTKVTLSNGYKTDIETRQHTYHADEPLDAGGTDAAVTPMEMLMGSLGSCIAITMKLYADRKKWAVERIDIELDIERFNGKDYAEYEGDAQFVHEIREKITIVGDLTDEQRERLLDIATKCPVSRAIEFPAFFKRELVS